jgi:hypothetical protein
VRVHACVCTCAFACACRCRCVSCACRCRCVCVCVCACLWACACAWVCVCAWVCACAWECACAWAVCVHVHVHVQAFEVLLQEGAGYEQISGKLTDSIAQKIEAQLEVVMDKGFNKMSEIIESVVANQKELQTTSDTLANKTESLQKIASEISNNAKEASVSTDQLSSTMTTYKDALLSVQNMAPQGNSSTPRRNGEDPRLARDLDRKQHQILLELGKEMTEGSSITELKSKIDDTLREMDPPPPEGAKVQEINKLRNGGIIIQMMTKEAAVWFQDPANEFAFTSKLDANACIRDRAYPILVPRVPLTFDPSNQEHLREVEGMNNMGANTISKARWIKPEYRRHPKQRFAYATLSLSSANEANRLLRDGMYICSTRTYPKRLKYELKQCMKCRRWGHFASKCHATTDTCGTCGREHATRNCEVTDKRFCISCRSNDHAS